MKELLFGEVTTYKDNEYYIWINEDNRLEIYTWDKSKIDSSFTQESGNETLYKKVVQRDEIGDVYRFRKCFEYKGVAVSVGTTKQGKYNLCTDDAEVAKKFGFVADQFDRCGLVWYHKKVDIDDPNLVLVREDRTLKYI